jgi:2-dehydropantoate 2-reductase
MILIVGGGAVGTVLAAALVAAGREPVRLYTREKDRAAWDAVAHLRVSWPNGTPWLDLPRPALIDTLDLKDVDRLVLCVKFAALEPLLDQLPRDAALPAGCTVVSTLNGVEPLRLLRRRLADACIVPVSVMFNAQLDGPLHARLTTRPAVVVGGGDTRFSAALDGSGVQVQHAPGDEAVWGKLLVNLANALSALTHTTFRDLLTRRELRETYVAVVDEAMGVLDRAGIAYASPMPISFAAYRRLLRHGGPLAWWIARLRNGLREGSYPSMVADVEQGRATEVAQLNGEIVRLGESLGVDTPVARRVVALVEALRAHAPPAYLSPAQLLRELQPLAGARRTR